MSVDRPDPPSLGPQDAARRRLFVISVTVSLYRQWRITGRELERLARDLTHHDYDDGHRALDRVCVSLLVTDELIELLARELGGERAPTTQLGGELFAEMVPWLEAVRNELPSAALLLCSFTAAAETWREVAIAS